MGIVDSETSSDWERRVSDCLRLYGHRNWIVVADAAYPAHSKPGIETIVSSSDQISTLHKVIALLSTRKHIRPSVYTDMEIDFVTEDDAQGISAYRQQLGEVLTQSDRKRYPHEDIIAKLDQAAELFHILIIKTNMTIPYTSVFFELECGYWSPEAEGRLRGAMKKKKQR